MDRNRDFQIALLIDDISEAKQISDGLRELGIFAHYYQDLDDLWVSLNTYTPDLCIVDVKKMSQKNLLFKQHPKVKNSLLKYSFYYKKTTQMLLKSTHGLAHYGLIRGDLNINDQLKAIIKRREDEIELVEQNQNLMSRIERLKLRSHTLTQNIEKSSQKLGGIESVMEILDGFGEVQDQGEFKMRMVHLISGWKSCDSFGFYELNSTGQKLVSPQARGTKLNTLPDLWLTKSSQNGIENYALEMAYDVAYGVMGDDIQLVKICGAFEQADLILFLQMNDEISEISVRYLEDKLSSIYRKLLLSSKLNKQETYEKDIFSVMHDLDEQQFYKKSSSHRFVLVDFSNLINLIKQRNGNRFYWKSFSKEFQNEVTELLGSKTILSNYGTEYFLVGIDKNKLESGFAALKNYTEEFQYWRYFEDSTFVVGHDVSPSVRFVSPSSVSLLRNVKEGVKDIMNPQIRDAYSARLEV